MKFINVPLIDLHASYRPQPTSTMDRVESQLIQMACTKFEHPRILEIGTQYGETTANMARIVKVLGGSIVTVDVIKPPSTIPDIQKNDCRPKEEIGSRIPITLRSCVTQVLIDPFDKESLWNEIKGFEFDLAFVDGDHSYDGVMHDHETIMKLPKIPYILYHDVWWDVTPPPVEGPLMLVNQIGAGVLNMTHLGVTEQDARWLFGRA